MVKMQKHNRSQEPPGSPDVPTGGRCYNQRDAVRCSLSCLTGVVAPAVCVSHRCSQTLLRGRQQAATSAPGERQLSRGTGELQRTAFTQYSLPPSSPALPPLGQHITQMRLTFTQLSTLQRREIYSASGPGWCQASTWAGPRDDPVAQP